MLFKNGLLTEEALKELGKHVDMIECECPTYLIDILNRVRAFNEYTTECIKKYPKDAPTHMWGSPSMTGAVRESARMFLPQNVLAKGAPIAPNQTRIYHWIT